MIPSHCCCHIASVTLMLSSLCSLLFPIFCNLVSAVSSLLFGCCCSVADVLLLLLHFWFHIVCCIQLLLFISVAVKFLLSQFSCWGAAAFLLLSRCSLNIAANMFLLLHWCCCIAAVTFLVLHYCWGFAAVESMLYSCCCCISAVPLLLSICFFPFVEFFQHPPVELMLMCFFVLHNCTWFCSCYADLDPNDRLNCSLHLFLNHDNQLI